MITNMTSEISPSFDDSDYLNSQIRTSYLKRNKFKATASVGYNTSKAVNIKI